MKKKTRFQQDVALLAKDFRRWGRKATLLVQRGTKRWGTQFTSYVTVNDC